MDSKLSPFINTNPGITYRRASSLHDQLVRSHYSPEGREPCCQSRGTFRCRSCNVCPFISSSARHHVDCATEGIVYLMLCSCGCFYIGKTLRPFRVRIREHLYAARICDLSPIGRHRAHGHNYKPIQLLFTALDRLHPNTRGIDHCSSAKPSPFIDSELPSILSFKSFI